MNYSLRNHSASLTMNRDARTSVRLIPTLLSLLLIGSGTTAAIAQETTTKAPDASREQPTGAVPEPRQPNAARENSVGMRFTYIPPGEFVMGTPPSDEGRHASGTAHRVRMSRGFYLGVHEVTQGAYQRVMGANPSWFSANGGGKGAVRGLDVSRFPVEQVSWEEAAEFCRRLANLPAEHAAGQRYRLPTEAEWEYACRAGSTSRFHWGDSLNGDRANCDGTMPLGTSVRGPFLRRTTGVGSYPPNAWGVHDMHGNVFEWCADWYSADYYHKSPLQDPQGPQAGNERVFRGGCWFDDGHTCQAAFRVKLSPTSRINFLGFRVVLIPRDPDK